MPGLTKEEQKIFDDWFSEYRRVYRCSPLMVDMWAKYDEIISKRG